MQRGTSLTCSMRISMKPGGYVSGEFVGAPQIENGRIVGVLGIVRDVTERRRIEDALRESEERLRSIVQSTTDAIVLVNAVMKIAFWNKGAEAASDMRRRTSSASPSRRFFRHDITSCSSIIFSEPGSRSVLISTSSTLELVGVRKDGSEFLMELSFAAWKGKADLFLHSIIRDITRAHRHAEEELDRLNRHNQLVLNCAGEGIYGLDREGRTTSSIRPQPRCSAGKSAISSDTTCMD